MSRNWHYTLNRRLRRKGWDLRRYPDDSALFAFIPEFLQLQSRVDESNASDFASFINGLSFIAHEGGKIHSQLGQEAFIVGSNLQISQRRYLEIGAYDPYVFSNTAVLRNHFGWTGISVDPSVKSQESFTNAGLHDSFLRLAVGAKNGKVYFFNQDSLSFTTSEVPSDVNLAEEVDQISIRDLVKLVGAFDYLSIDIEGGEFEILSSFPWESNRPTFITVEHNNRSEEMLKMKALMQSLGYRIFLEGITDFEYWFIHDSAQSARD